MPFILQILQYVVGDVECTRLHQWQYCPVHPLDWGSTNAKFASHSCLDATSTTDRTIGLSINDGHGDGYVRGSSVSSFRFLHISGNCRNQNPPRRHWRKFLFAINHKWHDPRLHGLWRNCDWICHETKRKCCAWRKLIILSGVFRADRRPGGSC